VRKTFAARDAAGRRALRSEVLELVEKFIRATDGSMVVDAAYFEVVITRR
jgi:hypothetical protein